MSGKAVVCCIHDREKRQVTTEAQIAQLGLEVGITYDPKIHRVWECACCENLFVNPTDEPRYCKRCTATPIHQPAGPVAKPNGGPA